MDERLCFLGRLLAGEKMADLEGVGRHDLRHRFASIAVSAGARLPVMGAFLGHVDGATTHRHSHLHDHAIKAAGEDVGANLKTVFLSETEQSSGVLDRTWSQVGISLAPEDRAPATSVSFGDRLDIPDLKPSPRCLTIEPCSNLNSLARHNAGFQVNNRQGLRSAGSGH